MVLTMRELLMMTKSMEKENIFGMKKGCMKENGLKIIFMALVFYMILEKFILVKNKFIFQNDIKLFFVIL